MTAVAHLSTCLFLKVKFKEAPLLFILLATEVTDLIWVVLNLARTPGEPPIEISRVDLPFKFIGDLHLISQVWSHSLVGNLVLALVFAAIGLIVFKSLHAAAAGALAVLGHWGLDYLVHDADLPVLPYAKSVLAGPALGFNPEAPWQGLNATLPWLGYALQVIVVLICYRAFVQAYRPTARWVLIGALVFLNLAALPIFLQGAMSEIVTSTSGLVLGTLTDMLLASLVLYGAVRFAVPGAIPRLGPTSEALRTRLRGLQTGGALLALILGISHLAQGMWDGATNPSLAHWSTAFGIAYVLSGWTLFGPSPMALWTAFFLPILSGPLSRLFLGAGHLGLVHLALEIALATTAVYTIYKLKTSKLRI